MTGKRILVVEDNAKNMKLFRDILRAKGYDILEASSGEDAVDLAMHDVPNLVLMDIQLPGMDGLEALGQLRADPRTSTLRVIALTAQAMDGDEERFLAAGFDDYISKPVNVLDLLATVDRYCNETGN